MKKLAKGLKATWKYVHPLIKFSYWMEKSINKILREINPAPFFHGVLTRAKKRTTPTHTASRGVLKRCWIKMAFDPWQLFLDSASERR